MSRRENDTILREEEEDEEYGEEDEEEEEVCREMVIRDACATRISTGYP